MHKGLGIVLMLACLPVQMVMMSEPVSAQTASDQKAEADRLFNQGIQLYGISKYQEALQSWEQALTIYRAIKNRKGEGQSLGNLGIVYKALGKYEKAIEFYLQFLAIAREIKDLNSEYKVLGNLGLAYDSLGKYEKAIEFQLQSLAIAREIKDLSGEYKALGNLGLAYNALSKYEKAIEFYLQFLAIAREIKNRSSEGISLGNLGNAYRNLGKYDKAIEFHLQSLAIAREIKNRSSEGNAFENLGLAYLSVGKYEKAIEFYLQFLEIAREIKNRSSESEGVALGNLGLAYHNIGKYEKAIEFQLQSLAIARELKDRWGEGASLGNLGNTYQNLGNYEKAIEFHLQHLEVARKIKDRLGEGNSLGSLGIAYDILGKYDKAIESYLQSLEIAREIKDLSGEGNSFGNLGTAYRKLGKYDKAIEFYLQHLEIARKIKDRNSEGISLGNLGVTYFSLGKHDKAIEFQLQFLAIAREVKNRNGERISLNNLGASFTNLKQPELAILFYKQSVNVIESIRQDIKKLSKDDQKSYLDTVEKTYRNLADLLLKQGRVMESLQVLDLLKVQELEDYLKNIKGSDRSAQGVRLLEPEKAISDKLLAVSFENSSEINSQLAKQIQQLPKSEINKVPNYLNQIPQGSVLLYPLILEDRLEIILFSPNTLPISRTVNISKTKLEELIVEFRNGLRDSGFEDYKEPAVALYNALIKPIEAELIQAKAQTILYAPDGILRYIPLAALNDGKQWLSEKYRISNLIAYTLSDFSPKPKLQPNILAGAFGGKAGELKFGQKGLPATLKEVQAIANAFPNSETLLEDNFSRQATEAKFKNYNILHFATHAEFNTGAPDNSFIIFGNGDKIRLSELTDWQIPNVELIVLSACQTGVGKLGTGVEILGFGYQVQKIGAKNAIASLWSVDDAGTQALMEAFYKELKKGDASPTEALQKAQAALIKSDKFKHPFYWSAFFAIGNGL